MVFIVYYKFKNEKNEKIESIRYCSTLLIQRI